MVTLYLPNPRVAGFVDPFTTSLIHAGALDWEMREQSRAGKCLTTQVWGFVRVVSTVVLSITHPEIEFAKGIIAKELISSTYIASFIKKIKTHTNIKI